MAWNKYPYTDNHELNLDWFLSKFKNLLTEWGSTKEQIDAFEASVNQKLADIKDTVDNIYIKLYNIIVDTVNDVFGDDITAAVKDWLDDHPEATTTVQDGALTEPKFANSLKLKAIKDYVTPEMYGAVGDGSSDDTNAWQQAVDSGKNVIATKKSYKCGKITVTNNISINCNGADFICTDLTLFELSGDVITTLTNENNYSANNSDYILNTSEYVNYSGYAMIKGTNNFMPTRDYYKGGFVCSFNNGRIQQPYPINVTGLSVEILSPITAELYNIGSITHIPSGITFSILVLYGVNCNIHDINGHYSSYTVISLNKCVNCYIDHIDITNDYTGQSYIVVFANSSFCQINDSILYNKEFHAVSTGDIYLCYKNSILNSTLLSKLHYAYVDHHNGLGTQIENCIISCMVVTGLCNLKNLAIVPNNTRTTSIRVASCPLQDCAIYNISDIMFHVDNNVSTNTANGINITATADQVTGKTFYVTKAFISNCESSNDGLIYYTAAAVSTENLILNNITFDNFQGNFFGSKTDNINIENYVLNIRNIKNYKANIVIGASNTSEYNIVNIYNSKFYAIRGQFAELKFSMIEVSAQMNSINVTGKLIGNFLIGFIPNAQLLIPTRLSINMISVNDNYTYFNYVNDNNGNKYYSSYVNGALVVTQIT